MTNIEWIPIVVYLVVAIMGVIYCGYKQESELAWAAVLWPITLLLILSIQFFTRVYALGGKLRKNLK